MSPVILYSAASRYVHHSKVHPSNTVPMAQWTLAAVRYKLTTGMFLWLLYCVCPCLAWTATSNPLSLWVFGSRLKTRLFCRFFPTFFSPCDVTCGIIWHLTRFLLLATFLHSVVQRLQGNSRSADPEVEGLRLCLLCTQRGLCLNHCAYCCSRFFRQHNFLDKWQTLIIRSGHCSVKEHGLKNVLSLRATSSLPVPYLRTDTPSWRFFVDIFWV